MNYSYTQKSHDIMDQENTWGANNYLPIPVVLERGEGCWVWDVEGNKYLDMMAAYSALSFGYGHPKIMKAFHEQADKLAVTSRAFYTDRLGEFLEKLCRITGFDKALPSNGGVEGVETAIKCVRRWGYEVKGIPTDQAEIIVAKNNFHGRTTTVISFSTESENRRGFSPLTPGFVEIPFNDVAALEAAITPNTCAVLIEPVQGEGGIIVPDPDYHKSVEAICKRNNVLYIMDEIQSGMARTGRNFAFELYGVKPDGLILGKALGGGILPVSAFLARDEVMSVFNPGSHGSTYGGNPLACAVAIASIETMVEEDLAKRSHDLGEYLKEQLRAMDHKLIRDVRGVGLWIGVDIDPKYATARDVCERLAINGALSKETKETVVRIAPPLTITKEQLDYGLERMKLTLDELAS